MHLSDEQLVHFVITLLERVSPLVPSSVPYAETPLGTIRRFKDSSKAQRRAAIGWLPDVLAIVLNWPAEARRTANEVLLRHGAVGIGAVWAHNNRKLMQIIERQVIRNRTEYERCKVALEDFPEAFTHAERESIERLMLKYEKF